MISNYDHAATLAMRSSAEPITAYKVYRIEASTPAVLRSPYTRHGSAPHTSIHEPGEKRIPHKSLIFLDPKIGPRRRFPRNDQFTCCHVCTLSERHSGTSPNVPGFYSHAIEADAKARSALVGTLVRLGQYRYAVVPVTIAPSDVIATNGEHIVSEAITITPEAFSEAIGP